MSEFHTASVHPSAAGTLRKMKPIVEMDSLVVRFGGDSGDGIQIIGDQFTNTAAVAGDYFATLPDYPSEIRAPAGTVFGVSGFQLCISGREVYTPGDLYDVLLAMNPAALKTNLPHLKEGGIVIVNEDSFIPRNLEKAGFTENPLEGQLLSRFSVARVSMTTQTQVALEGSGLSSKEADRCKNFFALGLLYGLFNRSPEYTMKWLEKKFQAKQSFLVANLKTLAAGLAFANEGDVFEKTFKLKRSAKTAPGIYRNVTGNTAAALGLMMAAQKSGLRLFLGSYPITPATDILHELSKHKNFATIFQAEDEIAGIGSALGASFGGALGVTTTSGPGFSLKSEFMNLAVMTELPLIIVDVQRGGPSTGLPTKTEQSDLFQALWGRHGESPIVVLAASTPKDCFDVMIEAARIAVKYMTPVVVLSDSYLGNGSEVWRVPSLDEIPDMPVKFRTDPKGFLPYERNPETLGRPWAIPGTPGLEHRLGGLEKEEGTGTVNTQPLNHEKMVHLRAEKIARVANDIAPMVSYGSPDADLLVLGWGGTEGVIKEAVRKLNGEGQKVACAHLRHMNPMPKDLGSFLKKYKKVLVPENNLGQLWYRLRAEYLLDTEKFSLVQGRPFRVDEIETKIKAMLGV